MRLINHILRAFCNARHGNIIIESVIFLPAMIFTYIAFAVAWDAHRNNNLAQKATYAIADIISRERGVFKRDFLVNYLSVFGYVAEYPTSPTLNNMAGLPFAIRITSVLFDATNTPKLQFSYSSSSSRNRLPPILKAADLEKIKNKIPALKNGDSIIIVETLVRWTPLISAEDATDLVDYDNNRSSAADNKTWFVARDINTFTTVRPRFVPQLCYGVSTTTYGCEL